MRRYLILLAAIAAFPAHAHDFWLQPARFQVAPGAPVPVRIFVGHGRDRERWGGAIGRVVRFEAVTPGGRVVDLRRDLSLGGVVADAIVRFAEPGVNLVAFETTHAFSDLPAVRFNDFARTEGLTPAIEARRRAGRTQTNGREKYSRRVKVLVEVGASGGGAQATRRLGHTLELVPERSPYALGRDRRLPVRVFYQGRPLGGALVKLNDLNADDKPVATALTGRDGRVAFTVPPRGLWQFNVVWTRPISGDAAADFDTTFASLVFGYGAQ